MDDLIRLASEQERRTAEMVLRDLINRRSEKVTGEICYRVALSEGSIRDRWVETKSRVK